MLGQDGAGGLREPASPQAVKAARSLPDNFGVLAGCFCVKYSSGEGLLFFSLLEADSASSEASDSSEKYDLVNPHFLWELFYWTFLENLLETM